MAEEETPTVEDITVEVRICPDKHGKITVGHAGKGTNASSSSTDDDGNVVLTVGLNPVGENCADDTQTVTIPIIKAGKLPAYCDDEDWFWWERELDIIRSTEEEPILERLPTLHMLNPDCCKWREAVIKTYGPSRCGTIEDFHHGCEHIKYDAGHDVKGNLGEHYSEQVPQNTITPGMLVKLWHRFSDDIIEAGKSYWCTCCFTGGTVVAVNGEYGDPEISYVVAIEGKNIHAKSYGFEEYHIGDWVIIAKPAGQCGSLDREDACKDGCEGTYEDGASYSSGGTILEMVNSLRAGLGLQPLSMNTNLSKAAMGHSKDMQEHCTYLGHTGSDGSTYIERIIASGYISGPEDGGAGENVGLAVSDQEMFDGWVNSPPHYANLIYPDFKEMGLGIAPATGCSEITMADTGEIWLTHDFSYKFYTQTFGWLVDDEPVASALTYRIIPMKIGQDGA